ncbi:hypothetical protein Rrhod_0649 [Rhodococcus rhodnii LMG 5362]|uniref:N-acetyltransferase domain-containing protein n=1 Tax=Rhodococcus rhodnii LMG 5362 TaxID=1273125 RepID=R7WRR9_9NOCA|nr:hypothetical protein Rrhod_0649 [Rhodococcus rhodnii LMG 5362]
MDHILQTRGPVPTSRETPGGVDEAAIRSASVVDSPEHERFELWLGTELVGILGYRDGSEHHGAVHDDAPIAFMHTVVREEYGHRGLASLLVAGALAHARDHGWTVDPVCTYVQRYLDAHPQEADAAS